MTASVLIFPGIGNSGPGHWQSLWEQDHPDFERVQQRDWDNPICDEWAVNFEAAVANAKPNAIVVAHSLACLVVAQWASKQHTPIKAALLVAVPNPIGPSFPQEASGFLSTPEQRFDFRSIVVASTDDPYTTLEHTSHLASVWGSELVNIGNRGHINTNSGLGAWLEGYELVTKLHG